MSQLKQNRLTDVEIADSGWKSLYKVGSLSAWLFIVLLVAAIVLAIATPPPPDLRVGRANVGNISLHTVLCTLSTSSCGWCRACSQLLMYLVTLSGP